ncbi:MAG: cell division protein ZapE [Gemmobacter sp.]
MTTLTAIWEARVAAGALRPDPAQAAVLPRLEALRLWLEAQGGARRRGMLPGFLRKAPEVPRGLYLWGGVGRGKSMLMDLFFAETAITAKRRVHFHAFMQEIQKGLHAARGRGAADALAPVAEAVSRDSRLLCFDEMQITDIADAMIVGRLFQFLLDAGVVIVTTSNRPPDDLYKDGLNRALFLPFIDLIAARLDIVALESPNDWRQHRLAGAPVWFVPPGAAARAALDAIWADLTGGAAGAALTLTVNGRAVVIDRFAGGVARGSFWDFCGRPLGPADFLAIAAAVRVLMVEDIPRLSAANYNEARRFVTLIDTLYEARVRLVASAADAPEKLYLEGTGSFEFARTASRLRAMQGADWGG